MSRIDDILEGNRKPIWSMPSFKKPEKSKSLSSFKRKLIGGVEKLSRYNQGLFLSRDAVIKLIRKTR
jgi:hypothetical protein